MAKKTSLIVKMPAEETKEQIEQLVRLCKKGDFGGFSRLVDIYSSRLYGYFYRLAGNRDDANELLSELFLKITEKIGSCKAETFEPWLFRIASNLFTDYIRTKKRREKMLKKLAEQCPTEVAVEKDNYLADKLTRQIQKLDSETAELITLRFYSGLSFEQLAKMRNEPIGTCLSKVHRGIKKLRQLMENENG
jgi:RNA polymerase sigma-70 factor (ECF subfamily)